MTLKNRKQAERPPKFCDFVNIERGKSHQIIGIHLIYIMRESPIIRHLRSLKAILSLKNECVRPVWVACGSRVSPCGAHFRRHPAWAEGS